MGLQTHTMAPVNLLCKGFLKSLVTSDAEQKEQRQIHKNVEIDEKYRFLYDEFDLGEKSEEDEPEFIELVESRRVWFNHSEKLLAKKDTSVMEHLNAEKNLTRIMKQSVLVDLIFYIFLNFIQ